MAVMFPARVPLALAIALCCGSAAARAADEPVFGPPEPSAAVRAAERERLMPLRPVGMQAGTPATGAPASAGEPSGLMSIVSMAVPLALVLGGAVAAMAVLRKLMGGGLSGPLSAAGKAPAGLLEVLAKYPVARGQSLLLVKLDTRVLLLSHATATRGGGGGMTTLCEVTAPEDVASILLKVGEAEGKAGGGEFRSAMERFERTGVAEEPAVSKHRRQQGAANGDRAELWDAGAPAPRSEHGNLGTSAGLDPVRSLRQRLAALKGGAA